jgi:hypothetical protein
MFFANEVRPFAAPLSVGNKLLLARLLASLRLTLVRHERILTALRMSVNSNKIAFASRCSGWRPHALARSFLTLVYQSSRGILTLPRPHTI